MKLDDEDRPDARVKRRGKPVEAPLVIRVGSILIAVLHDRVVLCHVDCTSRATNLHHNHD